MKCPKCGYRQAEQPECGRCGVIFAKYAAYQEKRKHAQHRRQPVKKKQQAGILFLWGAVALSVAGIGVWLVDRFAPADTSMLVTSKPKTLHSPDVQADSAAHEKRFSLAEKDTFARLSPVSEGLAGQLNEDFPIKAPLDAARNATVSIVTPWGNGSGFFVDRYGTIITNRHVVQFDPDQLQKMTEQVQQARQRLEHEGKNIELARQQLKHLDAGQIRQQLQKNILIREEQYDRYRQQLAKLEQSVSTIKESDFINDGKVVLIDGSEYPAASIQYSTEYDLAMLAINVFNSPVIPVQQVAVYPDQGSSVYTIGSPLGLHHTVTSGIVSGYRELSGKRYVQVDAPINPGNSGGPLVNADGVLLGVNTMIFSDTEGIGFAIPVDTIRQAFPGIAVETE